MCVKVPTELSGGGSSFPSLVAGLNSDFQAYICGAFVLADSLRSLSCTHSFVFFISVISNTTEKLRRKTFLKIYSENNF